MMKLKGNAELKEIMLGETLLKLYFYCRSNACVINSMEFLSTQLVYTRVEQCRRVCTCFYVGVYQMCIYLVIFMSRDQSAN